MRERSLATNKAVADSSHPSAVVLNMSSERADVEVEEEEEKPIHGGVEGKETGKTIEEIYQKKKPLEHILSRPDAYGTFRLIVRIVSLFPGPIYPL